MSKKNFTSSACDFFEVTYSFNSKPIEIQKKVKLSAEKLNSLSTYFSTDSKASAIIINSKDPFYLYVSSNYVEIGEALSTNSAILQKAILISYLKKRFENLNGHPLFQEIIAEFLVFVANKRFLSFDITGAQANFLNLSWPNSLKSFEDYCLDTNRSLYHIDYCIYQNTFSHQQPQKEQLKSLETVSTWSVKTLMSQFLMSYFMTLELDKKHLFLKNLASNLSQDLRVSQLLPIANDFNSVFEVEAWVRQNLLGILTWIRVYDENTFSKTLSKFNLHHRSKYTILDIRQSDLPENLILPELRKVRFNEPVLVMDNKGITTVKGGRLDGLNLPPGKIDRHIMFNCESPSMLEVMEQNSKRVDYVKVCDLVSFRRVVKDLNLSGKFSKDLVFSGDFIQVFVPSLRVAAKWKKFKSTVKLSQLKYWKQTFRWDIDQQNKSSLIQPKSPYDVIPAYRWSSKN